ncbi:DUF6861 domain-containing protein [Acidicapsa dinghuensis]|uniref:DUF6861 domain-containing protein n=1 Tax=Acidicapsa dinghuensis TaxID=2218256 RepID=A0ABW1EJA5_9BACT|nr:hypothetical protein [Acidicapsa dinghuensis]
MGAARPAGPTCGSNNPADINDGTLCRAQSPAPASTGWDWFSSSISSTISSTASSISNAYDSAYSTATADYAATKTKLQSMYSSAGQYLRSDYDGARCLYQAATRAIDLAPAAVYEETGYELKAVLKGLLPGLVQMIVILGVTTFLGAAIGGIVGFFFGGVGAAPGAAVGGDLGFDIGMAVLTWLGLAFLVESIASGFVELLHTLKSGVETAWAARKLTGKAEENQVERAAHLFASCVAILVRLILQGIVAYLLKKAAVGATRSAVATARMTQAQGASAVAEANLAELLGKLRASKLGDGFADWVEKNWRNLTENPKLKPKVAETAGGAGGKLAELQEEGAARRDQSYDDIADYKQKYQEKEQEAREAGENRRAGGFKSKVTEAIGEDESTQYMQNNYPDYVMDQGFSPGTGFDQVYTQYDAAGNPTGMMIVEAKGPGASLSTNAAKGPQMSQEWVQNTVTEMTNSSDPATQALGQRLQNALDTGDPPVTGKVIQAQPGGGAQEIPLPPGPVYNGGQYN